jgi:glycosyltransferase involved in cell wall biosynthesis
MSLNNKKVLMVNDHIHFGGGGDAAFRLERKILERAGCEVYTYSQSVSPEQSKSDADIVFKDSPSRSVRKLGKFLGNPRQKKHFKAVLNRLRPDLVKLHLLSNYPGDMYADLEPYYTIQMLHGPNLFCATSWGAHKRDSTPCPQGIGVKCVKFGCIGVHELPLHLNLSRRINAHAKNNVNIFQSPSRQLADTAEKLGFKPVEYFPLSVDPQFEIVEPSYEDNDKILYVGALVEAKGVEFLIRAMPQVVKHRPLATLDIAGRGEDQSRLVRLVESIGMKKNIRFLGFQSRNDVIKLYQKASVLVVPSIWREQFGLVGPEALACGVPCIGSDIGGIPEWLQNEKSGYLVPPRDSAAIADRLIKLLMNQALRAEFGIYGRDFVLKNFSATRFKDRVLGQLDNL